MKKVAFIISLAVLTLGSLTVVGEDAKAIFEKQCVKCHGADGKGDTKMGQKLKVKDYSDAKIQEKMKDEEMFKAIKEGRKEGEKTLMKPAENVTDDQVKALVAYVRSLKK